WRHLQVDRREGCDGEVVAEEAGRTGQMALRSRGAQRQCRDVAAAWAPDLPVVVHYGGETPVAGRLDRRLLRNVTHDPGSPPSVRARAQSPRSPRRAVP